MIKFKRALLFIAISVTVSAGFAHAAEVLKLATTTSTYETGILDYILPPFEAENGCKVHVISVGTGKAIQLAKNGDVDIILVHAREAEDKFVNEGYGVDRQDVMYNDFVILGPAADPAEAADAESASEALKKIYSGKCAFISRGDDSGTDKKEKYLWSKAGLSPRGIWYQETGQGMSATLRVADEKNAYVLIDRATYLFNKGRIRLKKIVEGDSDLFNPYGVIAVNPQRYPYVNFRLSEALIKWLISPRCQRMITEYTVKGKKLFYGNKEDEPSFGRKGTSKDILGLGG